MNTVLESYRTAIAGQPACADPFFADRLRLFRAGDEEAGRAISGSCLGLVLGLVESLPGLPAGLNVIDAVQEGNAALVDALQSFGGASAEEFVEHARRAVLSSLSQLTAA